MECKLLNASDGNPAIRVQTAGSDVEIDANDLLHSMVSRWTVG